jgi:hypothetical protein
MQENDADVLRMMQKALTKDRFSAAVIERETNRILPARAMRRFFGNKRLDSASLVLEVFCFFLPVVHSDSRGGEDTF